MRNIWIIAKKELRGYFTQPTAYILMTVFLALSYFFYFQQIAVTGEAGLRPLFSLLPWLLMFFIPAITMGLLAKEKDGGTMEALATKPVSSGQILTGKFLGAMIFCLATVLITLTIPISLSGFGDFDLGAITGQYLGSLFLIGSFLVIGLWASAITKNQIVAFVIGLTVNFGLVLVGLEIVTLSLPYPVDNIFQKISVFDHFYNMTRGVIDARDIIYFFGLMAIFGALASFSLTKSRGGRAARLYGKAFLVLIAAAIVLVGINLAGDRIRGRIDLTEGQRYTLSPATKEIFAGLEKEIEIHFFVSKQIPTQLSLQAQEVKDLLNDYRLAGQGKVVLRVYYPDVNASAETIAQEYNIPAVQFNVVAKDELSVKKGYLGLAIQSGIGQDKKMETIPFADNLNNLEYKISSFILGMTKTEKKKIGWLSGHGEKNLYQDFGYLNDEAGKQYELTEIILKSEEDKKIKYNDVPSDLAALVIAGPTEKLTPEEILKINGYLKNGGSAFIMNKTIETNPASLTATSTASNLNVLLAEWGVEVKNDLLYDLKSHDTVSVGGGIVNYLLPYPLWVRALAASEVGWLNNIQSIILPWTASVEEKQNKLPAGAKTKDIFTTSDAAGTMEGAFDLDPQQNWSAANLTKKKVIVSVETDNTRILVVGNAEFVTASFALSNQSNAVMFINGLDWLAQDDVLSAIRAKNLTKRRCCLRVKHKRKRLNILM